MNDAEVIKFYAWDENVERHTLAPVPAYKHIPTYWRELPRYVDGPESNQMLTVKHCMPFFDAMSAGYYYLLPCDVKIKTVNNRPVATWKHPVKPLAVRSNLEIPSPVGHYQAHYSWQMWWGIKMPPGWSALITNPLNHHTLPFTTTSGLVDYDKYIAPGNIGFFIKEGFEGVIPAGTPIFQIIPVKRGDWNMEIEQTLRSQGHIDHDEKLSKPRGHYKKSKREDKKYR